MRNLSFTKYALNVILILVSTVLKIVNGHSLLFVMNAGTTLTSLYSFHLPTAELRFDIALDVLAIL
jgi:hypothetical protein